MKPALLWLQSLTCNGNAHSFFNLPTLKELMERFRVIYHPLLPCEYDLLAVLHKNVPCDVLVIEGAIDSSLIKECIAVDRLIDHYAQKAQCIITAGSCATYGGIFRQADTNRIEGFVFADDEPNKRFERFSHKCISIPGCPVHPQWLALALEAFVSNVTLELDRLLRPKVLFGYTVHEGCIRNVYFEWKVDAKNFGQKEGCLYYEHGCQGPHTRAPCNHLLWHDVSSKTRVGTPCFGCTEPFFPKRDLFTTPKHMGMPARLPTAIPKRAYLSVAGVAKSFHIEALEKRREGYE